MKTCLLVKQCHSVKDLVNLSIENLAASNAGNVEDQEAVLVQQGEKHTPCPLTFAFQNLCLYYLHCLILQSSTIPSPHHPPYPHFIIHALTSSHTLTYPHLILHYPHLILHYPHSTPSPSQMSTRRSQPRKRKILRESSAVIKPYKTPPPSLKDCQRSSHSSMM